MEAEPIDTKASGEIDYAQLEQRLAANRDKPAIININVGTTVKVSQVNFCNFLIFVILYFYLYLKGTNP